MGATRGAKKQITKLAPRVWGWTQQLSTHRQFSQVAGPALPPLPSSCPWAQGRAAWPAGAGKGSRWRQLHSSEHPRISGIHSDGSAFPAVPQQPQELADRRLRTPTQ